MAKAKTISTKNYERKITKATYHQNKKETTKSGNRIAMQKCNYPKQNCPLLKSCSIKKIILQVKLAANIHKI